MLQNVTCFCRLNGKLRKMIVWEAKDYNQAIWSAKCSTFGDSTSWFQIKQPVMALVQK